MTHLDFTAQPGGASTRARITAHAQIEAQLTLRNGEQLLLAFVIPVGLLVAGLLVGDRFSIDKTTWPAVVMGLALWSSTFTSVAITTGFERRYHVLERLSATPLRHSDLLVGKALATTAIVLGQLGIVGLLAVAMGWRPAVTVGGSVVWILGAALAGFGFTTAALAIAGSLRAEATLAVANLIYLVGAMAGLLVPAAAFPPVLATVVAWLPTGLLGDLARTWAIGAVPWPQVLGLAAWALVGVLVARRLFRWLG